MNNVLLSLSKLSVVVRESPDKYIIENVGFDIERAEAVGIVGGSGSGKTTTAMALLGLLPVGLKVKSGQLRFENMKTADMTGNSLDTLRAKKMGMVFQEPLDAFNPVFTIGEQIREVVVQHTTSLNSKNRVLELLDLVKVPDPMRIYHQYPHQLSGGLRQRTMIAQAVAAHPKLLIADEPTSNLDVTLQAKILELFVQLRRELDMSLLLITHDLGLVKHICDRVIVMEKGRILEVGNTQALFNQPQNKFTQELIRISDNV